LNKHGIDCIGASRSGDDLKVDVADIDCVREVIATIKPSYIFHLAGTSSTSHEFLWENHTAIATGTLAILDAVEKECRNTRVVLVGSGLQFVNDSTPISEDAQLDSSSPYVVARNHSLFASRYYRTRGLIVKFGFLFNHDSPKRNQHHLNMKIAQFAARATTVDQEKLQIGDITAIKEFGFAGDIMEALWILANNDQVDECVLGTGIGHSVEEWLEKCFNIVGLNWRDHVSSLPGFKSPYSTLVSSPKTIMSLGWQPKIGINDLAKSLMFEALRRLNQF
jgi:GDPmannose 4,6-dehydratase